MSELIEQAKIPKILIPALRQYRHNDGLGVVHGFDYNETIKAFTLDRNATQDEAKPIESALKALVELKDYKDEFGKTAYYIQRQPIVWNDARRAIDNLRGNNEY